MDQFEPYYKVFADYIVDAVSEQWSKAWIFAAIRTDFGRYYGRYQETDDNPSLKSFLIDESLQDKIVEFWELYKEAGNEPWYSITFTLLPDGKFNLRFDYEDAEDEE